MDQLPRLSSPSFCTNKKKSALASAHWTFTTRRVNREDAAGLSGAFGTAKIGDLVLCEIVEVNQHNRLQLTTKRYKTSYVGDLIVACVGDRYAPDQYQGTAQVNEQISSFVGRWRLSRHGRICP